MERQFYLKDLSKALCSAKLAPLAVCTVQVSRGPLGITRQDGYDRSRIGFHCRSAALDDRESKPLILDGCPSSKLKIHRLTLELLKFFDF
ncbi:hypothetical protein Baya_3380 [Bagarius yarrelli]|uniref:Uncharacterized protein n=1 Tax=Bagarius yarrelli TaxID=175774 RepID=A0A556TSG8_BAGYA|nr:hypothetical protein Baya_3380 [Bagarius yarrelli]